MQFFISQLLLWPKSKKLSVRTLDFAEDKVNVVHGRSRTGKSSIIAIIDYCLGASRCAIPVGTIRQKTAWFGLRVRANGTWLLIARRSPEKGTGSGECFISVVSDRVAALPQRLEATHTIKQFKDAFNRLTRVTNISLVEEEDAENSQITPSYRDLAAFNFLPQHIVANPNVLFYKADSYKHRDKLKRILPYALGIVDAEYLIKARERAREQKVYDALMKERETRRIGRASWVAEINQIWDEAVALGLIGGEDAGVGVRFSELRSLNAAYLEGRLTDNLVRPQYGRLNELFREATEREVAAQRTLDDLVQEVRDYERLAGGAEQLSEVVDKERGRVVNLDWLKRSLVRDEACVVCGSTTAHNHAVLEELSAKLEDANRLSKVLRDGPIVDRQLEELKNKLTIAESELHAARMRRLRMEPKSGEPPDSLGRLYVLIGRIQSLLSALKASQGDGSLHQRLDDAEERIARLDEYFENCGRERREAEVAEQLDTLIRGYAKWFGLNSKGTVALDQNELTLSFARSQGKPKDYLWEIGSGENWMAYHVSTFLALQEYFTRPKRINGPVFSFLAIDQPSQVYFPSAHSGENPLDEYQSQAESLKDREGDIEDTRKIFRALSRGIERSDFKFQIIVVEHADKSIWGRIKNVHEVEAWKAKGEGLIPREWLLVN
ncbi:DUF3732 domain-containing protein [Paraburkholderia tropica]|uniref:DUF3732 domain-containing protein n=1 Tax=Paraburkholderia tropica TaxID=92647 RepID=UPI001590A660|nr:DUF3732 domain-containing protein [Paraburkholderia tropica]